MAIAVPLNEGASPTLKQKLKRAERVNRWKAQALIAPLVLFLLLVFLVPIVAFYANSRGGSQSPVQEHTTSVVFAVSILAIWATYWYYRQLETHLSALERVVSGRIGA